MAFGARRRRRSAETPRVVDRPPGDTSSAFTVKNVGTSNVAEATISRFRTNARAQCGSAAILLTPNTTDVEPSAAARRDLVLTSAMNAAYRRRADLDARRRDARPRRTARPPVARARARDACAGAPAPARARAVPRAAQVAQERDARAARAATSAAKPATTSALTRAGAFETICTTRQRVARNSGPRARVPLQRVRRGTARARPQAQREARGRHRRRERPRVVMGDASSSSARATSWTSRGARVSRTPRLRSSVASDASETRVASIASPSG